MPVQHFWRYCEVRALLDHGVGRWRCILIRDCSTLIRPNFLPHRQYWHDVWQSYRNRSPDSALSNMWRCSPYGASSASSSVGFLFLQTCTTSPLIQEVCLATFNSRSLKCETRRGSLELTEEIMRLRAYQFFEERGCEHGHDLEDWLRAEAEVFGKKPAAAEQRIRKAGAGRR
jgi:Protein of unknown function (DUF2934)